MIRLSLKPAFVKNLRFNKKDETLEIEFKNHIKTSDCINIPLSVLHNYVETLKKEDLLEYEQSFLPKLKVVHSNFRAS